MYINKKLYGENLLRVFRAVEKTSINKKLLGEPTVIDRGWGEQDIKKLLGENLLRVFRAVEKVSIKKLLGEAGIQDCRKSEYK